MGSDQVLKAELEKARAECERLREENAKLRFRIGEPHANTTSKIPTLTPQINNATQASATVRTDSSPELKVSLFMNLFRGRDDVYAVRWEGKNGRTGYSPAGIREWEQAASARQGHKRSFSLSKLFPLDEEVIRDHLLGKQTIGVYPLLQDDTCWFVAADFDKKTWEQDASAFLRMCQETDVPALLERSRSGNRGGNDFEGSLTDQSFSTGICHHAYAGR